MNEEANKIYNSFLDKKQKIQQRRTDRVCRYLKKVLENAESASEDFQDEEEHDEHELSEAAQLCAAALYDILCKCQEDE